MKTPRILPLLLTMLLMVSASVAQTKDTPDATGLTSENASEIAARCQYTPADDACIGRRASGPAGSANLDLNLAQAQRRFPGPPVRGRRPMAYPGYPSPWAEPGDGRSALIGAAIGFGLGATAGAQVNTDARGRVAGALIVGSIGALMGAAIGQGIPSFHVRRAYPPNSLPEEDEIASRASAVNPETAKTSSGQSGPPEISPAASPSGAENPNVPAPTVP
ncbi:MAG TPA: hypothetical protein VJ999_11315 [Candidatus Sulfotelmatobacter sp.]|nr:hypothetical protein [Candidatus Sulfotelmatobacter sp.]